MKKVKVKLKSTTPLLMNKYSVERQIQQKAGGRMTTKTYDSVVEAENSAYWKSSGKKELMIPAIVLYSAILKASSFFKIGKRSAKPILAGSIKIEPNEVGLNTDEYSIDTRAVVIQRSRVPKSRARVDSWEAEFTINYNDKMIGDVEILKRILIEAGERIGLMDFRPTCNGFYGCFDVVEFKPQK